MRIFVVRAEGAIGAWLPTQLIDHGHQVVVGTHRSPRNAGRVRGLSDEPARAGLPAGMRRHIGGSS